MPQPPRRQVARVARTGVLVVVLAAVGWALARQWSRVSPYIGRVSLLSLGGSLLMVLLGLAFGLLGWRSVLADLGSPVPIGDAGRTFYLGQLGKYLPGSVWPIMVQMDMGRRNGVPPRRMAAAGLVSIGLATVAAMLLAVLCLPFFGSASAHYDWVLLALPVMAVLLWPRVLNRLMALAFRVLRRPSDAVTLTGRGVLAGLGWFFAQWLCNGVHAWLLVRALGPTGGHAVAVAVAAGGLALASAAGLLFIIAPSGAGVRDVIFVLLLRSVLPVAGAATAVALLSRLLMVLADLLVAAGAGLTALGRRTPLAETTTPRPG